MNGGGKGQREKDRKKAGGRNNLAPTVRQQMMTGGREMP